MSRVSIGIHFLTLYLDGWIIKKGKEREEKGREGKGRQCKIRDFILIYISKSWGRDLFVGVNNVKSEILL